MQQCCGGSRLARTPGQASTRAPKATNSDALTAASLYLLAHSDKNRVLQAWDGVQFNNHLLNTLDNNDVTDTYMQIRGV